MFQIYGKYNLSKFNMSKTLILSHTKNLMLSKRLVTLYSAQTTLQLRDETRHSFGLLLIKRISECTKGCMDDLKDHKKLSFPTLTKTV